MEAYMATSLFLSKVLEVVIGTKDIIGGRRRRDAIYFAFLNLCDSRKTYIQCGSVAEGFCFEFSDSDYMSIFNNITVVDQQTQPVLDKLTLRMIYDQHHIGSVFLEPVNCLDVFSDKCFYHNGRKVLSSSVWLGQFIQQRRTQNGPCATETFIGTNKSIDVCIPFKCSTWPLIAYEFVQRKRLYGWPSPEVINAIVANGCYCVPIGDNMTEHSWLKWRVSFAPSEVKLVSNFSHSELKVYALLKIINNELLKTITDTSDGKPLLCAYFLKTTMFYVKENSPLTAWSEETIFQCFWMCFNFLIGAVEKSYLPHYFIPGNNLFAKRINGRNKRVLLQRLYTLRSKGVNVLYECAQIRHFKILQQSGRSIILTQSQNEVKYDREVCNLTDAELEIDNDNQMLLVDRILHVLTHVNHDIDLYLSFNMLCAVLQYKVTKLMSLTESSLNNNEMYHIRRCCRHYLLFCTNLDVSEGWLTLATFHYHIGQYDVSSSMCNRVMRSIKPWTRIGGYFQTLNAYDQKPFSEEDSTIFSKMKHIFAEKFHSNHLSKRIYPKELIPEIKNAEFENHPFAVHPQPYATFLQYLCCHQKNDTFGRDAALSQLLALLYDDIQGVESGQHVNCIMNHLIGICYELQGDYTNAYINYMKSARRESIYSSIARFRAEHLGLQYRTHFE